MKDLSLPRSPAAKVRRNEGEMKTKGYAKFEGGGGGGEQIRCIMGDVQVANSTTFILAPRATRVN